uniref:Cell division protein n=1 Tax=Prasiolopsis wulf-kochii TaxID=3239232 RepID=A0A097KJY4_9CHLO|nr:cell division protein [Prasiolopsis sp. SAG 84.81]
MEISPIKYKYKLRDFINSIFTVEFKIIRRIFPIVIGVYKVLYVKYQDNSILSTHEKMFFSCFQNNLPGLSPHHIKIAWQTFDQIFLDELKIETPAPSEAKTQFFSSLRSFGPKSGGPPDLGKQSSPRPYYSHCAKPTSEADNYLNVPWPGKRNKIDIETNFYTKKIDFYSNSITIIPPCNWNKKQQKLYLGLFNNKIQASLINETSKNTGIYQLGNNWLKVSAKKPSFCLASFAKQDLVSLGLAKQAKQSSVKKNVVFFQPISSEATLSRLGAKPSEENLAKTPSHGPLWLTCWKNKNSFFYPFGFSQAKPYNSRVLRTQVWRTSTPFKSSFGEFQNASKQELSNLDELPVKLNSIEIPPDKVRYRSLFFVDSILNDHPIGDVQSSAYGMHKSLVLRQEHQHQPDIFSLKKIIKLKEKKFKVTSFSNLNKLKQKQVETLKIQNFTHFFIKKNTDTGIFADTVSLETQSQSPSRASDVFFSKLQTRYLKGIIFKDIPVDENILATAKTIFFVNKKTKKSHYFHHLIKRYSVNENITPLANYEILDRLLQDIVNNKKQARKGSFMCNILERLAASASKKCYLAKQDSPKLSENFFYDAVAMFSQPNFKNQNPNEVLPRQDYSSKDALKLLKLLENFTNIVKNTETSPRLMSGYLFPDSANKSSLFQLKKIEKQHTKLSGTSKLEIVKNYFPCKGVLKLDFNVERIPFEFLFKDCKLKFTNSGIYDGPVVFENKTTNELQITNSVELKEWYKQLIYSDNSLTDQQENFFGNSFPKTKSMLKEFDSTDNSFGASTLGPCFARNKSGFARPFESEIFIKKPLFIKKKYLKKFTTGLIPRSKYCIFFSKKKYLSKHRIVREPNKILSTKRFKYTTYLDESELDTVLVKKGFSSSEAKTRDLGKQSSLGSFGPKSGGLASLDLDPKDPRPRVFPSGLVHKDKIIQQKFPMKLNYQPTNTSVSALNTVWFPWGPEEPSPFGLFLVSLKKTQFFFKPIGIRKTAFVGFSDLCGSKPIFASLAKHDLGLGSFGPKSSEARPTDPSPLGPKKPKQSSLKKNVVFSKTKQNLDTQNLVFFEKKFSTPCLQLREKPKKFFLSRTEKYLFGKTYKRNNTIYINKNSVNKSNWKKDNCSLSLASAKLHENYKTSRVKNSPLLRISFLEQTEFLKQPFFQSFETLSYSSFLSFNQRYSIFLFLIYIFNDILKKYKQEIKSFISGFLDKKNDASDTEAEDLQWNFRIIKNIKKNFDSIGGIDSILPELGEIVWFLRNSVESFGLYHDKTRNTIPQAILLTGPPGTGKTLLVQAIAGEAKVPVLIESASSLIQPKKSFNGPQRIKNLFQKAREIAPCIIFIDEIDTFGETRSGVMENPVFHDSIIDCIYPRNQKFTNNLALRPSLSRSATRQSNNLIPTRLLEELEFYGDSNTLSSQNSLKQKKNNLLMQLLIELDGVTNEKKVLVFAATNRPQILDSALTRPGRFNKILDLKLPNKQKRIEIIKLYSGNMGVEKNISLDYIANLTLGLSAADLAASINQSSIQAIQGETIHTIETLEYGIQSITGYITQKNKLRSFIKYGKNSPGFPGWAQKTRYPVRKTSLFFINRIAYYQAGKVVVHTLLKTHPNIISIHLWPEIKSPRYHLINSIREKQFSQIYRRIELESHVIGFYAGKAGEFLGLFQKVPINKNIQTKLQANRLLTVLQSDLGIQDMSLASWLGEVMVHKWYLYSKKISTQNFNQLKENYNSEQNSDVAITNFLRKEAATLNGLYQNSKTNLVEPTQKTEKAPLPSVISTAKQHAKQPWLQKRIAKKFEFFFSSKTDWHRIYSMNYKNDENTRSVAPDIYYHSNVYLKKINEYKLTNTNILVKDKFSSIVNWNDIYMLNRDYIYQSLLGTCFNKALLLIDQNRELLDLFATSLLRKEILREYEINDIIQTFLNNSVSANSKTSFFG